MTEAKVSGMLQITPAIFSDASRDFLGILISPEHFGMGTQKDKVGNFEE